jgi:hypothetical protein
MVIVCVLILAACASELSDRPVKSTREHRGAAEQKIVGIVWKRQQTLYNNDTKAHPAHPGELYAEAVSGWKGQHTGGIAHWRERQSRRYELSSTGHRDLWKSHSIANQKAGLRSSRSLPRITPHPSPRMYWNPAERGHP